MARRPPRWIARASALLLLVAIGCASERTPAPFPEMGFNVDSTRLGDSFDAESLSLRAPAGWTAAPAETLDEAMRRVGATGAPGADEPRLRALYRQAASGAALAVSAYEGACPADRRDRIAGLQEKGLAQRSQEVKTGRFGLHGFEIVQIRAVQGDRVLFKLLASQPPGPLFQLDYVLPRGVYMSELRAVESSIGSLRHP